MVFTPCLEPSSRVFTYLGSPKYKSPVNSRTIMISKPSTTSLFKVELSTKASKTFAGRRFAKRANSLRIPSKPRSGRCLYSKLSHFGPPTAPSKVASASLAKSKVSCGNGVPFSS